MDSYDDSRQAVTRAARAAAAVYIDYPPTPKWYYAAWAGWAASMVLMVGGAQTENPVLVVAAVAAVSVFTWLVVVWYRNYWGTWPANLWNSPSELRSTYLTFFAGYALIIAVTVGTYLLVGIGAAAAVAAVCVWPAGVTYERHYEASAKVARERLAGEPSLVVTRPLELDPVIDRADRLAAVALLANSSSTEAAFLRRILGVDQDELSDQMSALDDAGYVSSSKRFGRCWYRLTRSGRKAVARPLAAVNAIVKA